MAMKKKLESHHTNATYGSCLDHDSNKASVIKRYLWVIMPGIELQNHLGGMGGGNKTALAMTG